MGGDTLVALLVILAIVFVWRGPKMLPRLGQALGRSVKEVRHELESDEPETPETPESPGTPATPGAPDRP